MEHPNLTKPHFLGKSRSEMGLIRPIHPAARVVMDEIRLVRSESGGDKDNQSQSREDDDVIALTNQLASASRLTGRPRSDTDGRLPALHARIPLGGLVKCLSSNNLYKGGLRQSTSAYSLPESASGQQRRSTSADSRNSWRRLAHSLTLSSFSGVTEVSSGGQSDSFDDSPHTSVDDRFSDRQSILPRLPTKDARLKTFLVGNVGGKGSLLGEEELLRYFPDKKISVFVATWNMNAQNPPNVLDELLLPESVDLMPDIYCIGIQEGMNDKKEWEIRLQFTLGPSHVMLHSVCLSTLHMTIFIRRDLLWFCSLPEEAVFATRAASAVKTKGAVAISFNVFGISMLFINSHCTAHEKKLRERIVDYEKISNNLDLPRINRLRVHHKSKDVTARFDIVFWLGDLNYRLTQPRETVLALIDQIKLSQSRPYELLLKHDQLIEAIAGGKAFFGFHEGKIEFLPTFKYQIGSNRFDQVKMRTPSYTDRILYRSKRKDQIHCEQYHSVSAMDTSDHRPVFGVFSVAIRAGRDHNNIAAGTFNREVYLEAIRRRAAALEIRRNLRGGSSVCSTM